MAKNLSNKEIAKGIVDTFATFDEQDEATVCTIPERAIGSLQTFTAKNKSAASKKAIEHFESELNEGSLILSDTWTEDNLGGVK